ncbi:AI-2E family transporter [Phyllobacterium zundukense]|uniref:ABC transporter permease n=1 Tax=Phyllobacterium zundukense TaxID=1867719 RepID=A0A2N9VX13_9HYPH|nr:AI-2E family transporter [Phyllobacterium zundukense]ATU90291.1 ABC transporter permease [Phyllobacterium zundukense]PIO44031.1 ABC transporter permease [Phyllobacterium zundukense]
MPSENVGGKSPRAVERVTQRSIYTTSSGDASSRTQFPPVVVAIAIVAALYFARDIFVPLALALLLTFALSPLVTRLYRSGVPKAVAVISVVVTAFLVIFIFVSIVVSQLTVLAQNLPSYQYNIETKIRTIKDAQSGNSIFDRGARMFKRFSEEIGRSDEVERFTLGDDVKNPDPQRQPPQNVETQQEKPPLRGQDPNKPVPVEIRYPPPDPLSLLQTFAGPLIQPMATIGIVIVVVIFMLMRREDLRDRFIKLVGASDIHRTTTALHDAGKRVGQYLLMQLIINISFGVPIGIGLWFIGIPNPMLWGMLAIVLRFVPYIGPIIAASFPLILSLAVDPGWMLLVWTATLFVVLELISSNVMEPLLYGSKTGLSPVAILMAAIVWTWIWGPIGLILSTPLTVCLVVLGRHVPTFEFLDVLLGNEPVLLPPQQLYQRLLSGDPDEATEKAEEYLQSSAIADYYAAVAIPALFLAEYDRGRGVLDAARRARVAQSMILLVENLSDHQDVVDEAEDAEEVDQNDAPANKKPKSDKQKTIISAGGRGDLDDAAAVIVGDILEREDFDVHDITHDELEAANIGKLDLAGVSAIYVSYLNTSSVAHARYLVRRLRRRNARIKIIIGFWAECADKVDGEKIVGATRNCHVESSIQAAIERVCE